MISDNLYCTSTDPIVTSMFICMCSRGHSIQKVYVCVDNTVFVCQCILSGNILILTVLYMFFCVAKKGDSFKDDRRVEQKSNHLIAAFFISIFCFMAAEGRQETLAVIHGH